jgi:peptidoglycan hydrolase-like protein with peptidoglycan-binding domain
MCNREETDMMKARNLGVVIALGAVTALPACGMFGGGDNSSRYSESSAPATPPASYSTASATTGTSGTVGPVSPGMIRQVQSTLQQNGDYQGRVDGVWGPRTEQGVRTWQQGHNLTSNGQIDVATLQSMNIPAGSQSNAESAPPTNQANGANQPAGNQNYSTGATNQSGTNYSSGNPPPPNTPYPTDQGAANNGQGTAGH